MPGRRGWHDPRCRWPDRQPTNCTTAGGAGRVRSGRAGRVRRPHRQAAAGCGFAPRPPRRRDQRARRQGAGAGRRARAAGATSRGDATTLTPCRRCRPRHRSTGASTAWTATSSPSPPTTRRSRPAVQPGVRCPTRVRRPGPRACSPPARCQRGWVVSAGVDLRPRHGDRAAVRRPARHHARADDACPIPASAWRWNASCRHRSSSIRVTAPAAAAWCSPARTASCSPNAATTRPAESPRVRSRCCASCADAVASMAAAAARLAHWSPGKSR